MAAPSKPTTRTGGVCPIFGMPSKMRETVLPTHDDMMKHYLCVRNELKTTQNGKDPSVKDVAEQVTSDLKALWARASIPCISDKKILEKVRAYHDKYRSILKPYKERKTNAKYAAKLEMFAEEARSKLFDISACKCSDWMKCRCSKKKKVPIDEREFLLDQRNQRKMMIGSVDVAKTAHNMRRENRKNKEVLQKLKKSTQSTSTAESAAVDDSVITDITSSEYDSSDSDVGLSSTKGASDAKGSAVRNRNAYPSLALECDRHGVSDRAAAAVASAVLKDIGAVKKEDMSGVIDRSKIRRERHKMRQSLLMDRELQLTSLYFDGRKDKTLIQEKKGAKYYKRTVTEEHITLVTEPGSAYVTHVCTESGDAESISNAILNALKSSRFDLSHLIAIGCDGTNVNTGVNNGVIRRLEVELERPLQWFICMLHLNELPLRHLFQHLDGETSGPKSFTGPIGKALGDCEDKPVTEFLPIPSSNLPTEIDKADLSTDQEYLYNMCAAVAKGHCPPELAMRKPGPVVHSRWLTTASRLLRLYVSTAEPSSSLKALCSYVMLVYAPVWFSIKQQSCCNNGPRHFWKLISLSRYLESDLREVVDTVIQRNAFFAHPENLLIAMLTDQRPHIRELARRRILLAREKTAVTDTTTRQFRVPTVQFAASEYTELINWQEEQRTEPPLTVNLTDDDLRNFPSHFNEKLQFPCHTQGTERCVKLVTEASQVVCGAEARNGYILARITSRKQMKTFDTKSQFNVQ